MTLEIRVGANSVARIDDADHALVSGFRWFPHRSQRLVYARAEFIVQKCRVRLYMHRLIFDVRPGQLIDHRDGDGLNNQRSNLRICTHSENMQNRAKRKSSGRNPFKGVYRYGNSGRWLCLIRDPSGKRQITVGVFDDPEVAARAYDDEAVRLFGEFARLNFPSNSTTPERAQRALQSAVASSLG